VSSPLSIPDAVADTVASVVAQPADAMTHELDVRARGNDVHV